MALKPPPPPWEVLQQVGEMIGAGGLGGGVDKGARSLAQSALAKLDVVSREEFDAQAEILQKTRAQVEELETTLASLTQELKELEGR